MIDDCDWINAPSIALPSGEHWRIPAVKGNYTGTPQEPIAKVREFTSAPETSIQALIDLIRSM